MADVGRPPLYKTPEEMQVEIEKYFDRQRAEARPFTVVGLCLFLGYDDRHALAEIARNKPEFSSTVNRARTLIEEQRNETLVHADTKNTNGLKFDLQNNHGWKESSDLNLGSQADTKLNVTVTFIDEKPKD